MASVNLNLSNMLDVFLDVPGVAHDPGFEFPYIGLRCCRKLADIVCVHRRNDSKAARQIGLRKMLIVAAAVVYPLQRR